MAFQQQINPMDYAKKAGRQRRIADVLQDLQLQQAALPGEMDEYKSEKGYLDLGSSFLANYGTDIALGLLTGGTSTGASILKKFLGPEAKGFSKLLGMGAKGTGKSILSDKISDVLGKQFKIKAPEAPTVDMSKLTGTGMSGARQTIADALEVSGGDVSSLIEGFEGDRKLMNLMMSFGPELTESIDIGGKTTTIMDWFRDKLGLSALGKGTGSTVFSLADNLNPLKNIPK